MLGAVNKPLLLLLLIGASAFMAYRLVAILGGDGAGQPQAVAAPTGSSRKAVSARAAAGAISPLDPSLRLDLLASSRAVNYAGSKRNIFVFGSASGESTGAQSGGTQLPVAKTPDDEVPPDVPVVPPGPPPVVLPLKFFGVAQLSGTSSANPTINSLTKALLTNGDAIIIAQTGQTVAQHYKILRIGVSKLELEDIRDHSKHEIPLAEQEAPAPPPAR